MNLHRAANRGIIVAASFGATNSRPLPLLHSHNSAQLSPFSLFSAKCVPSSLRFTEPSKRTSHTRTWNQIPGYANHNTMALRSHTNGTYPDGIDDESQISTKLRFIGDKKLMQKQPAVTMEYMQSESFKRKLQILRGAMKEHGGIGIAAPQVGWWTRVFCFGIEGENPRYPAASSIPFTFWINPKITWESEETNFMWEGCLSVPGMRGWVERPSEVILSGMDENGVTRERRLSGLEARIAQHELDHLDGVLFPMCVPDAKFLVPQASMDAKDEWDSGWPSPGSRKTDLGELGNEK